MSMQIALEKHGYEFDVWPRAKNTSSERTNLGHCARGEADKVAGLPSAFTLPLLKVGRVVGEVAHMQGQFNWHQDVGRTAALLPTGMAICIYLVRQPMSCHQPSHELKMTPIYSSPIQLTCSIFSTKTT